MSGMNTAPEPTNIDRTAPYAVQMQVVSDTIQSYLTSRRPKIQLPVTFDEHGIPAFTADYALNTYTRKELLAALVLAHDTAREFGVAAYTDTVPSFTHTAKGFADALDHNYTVTKGANEGQVRNLMMHSLGAARRTLKRLAKQEVLAECVGNGDAWFADGVVDKDGKPRAYPSEAAARKAWARHADNYGAEWFVGRDKAAKDVLLAEADVYPQAKMVGKVVKSGAQASNPVNKYTIKVLGTMAVVTLKRLAKEAGAPESIRTGKGCKDRIVDWFAADVKRMSALNL